MLVLAICLHSPVLQTGDVQDDGNDAAEAPASEDSSPDASVKQHDGAHIELVGIWELQSDSLLGWFTEYHADGTYTFKNPQTIATGTYKAVNGQFINRSDISAELDFVGEYEMINSDRLVLTGKDGRRTVWIRKQ